MKRHRFIGDFDLRPGRTETHDAALANQVKNVLRLRVGEAVVLGDGVGREAEAVVLEAGARSVVLDVGEPRAVKTEPARRVTLYAAVLKRENFEWVAEKATECGVAEIVPVLSERTVKTGLREDRLRKIMREAAEQSGRGIVPGLGLAMTLKEALADSARHDSAVIFDIGEPLFSMPTGGAGSVGVFVGPEGGWTAEEVAAARAAGLQVAGLGPRTLRGETAAAVAVFLAAT